MRKIVWTRWALLAGMIAVAALAWRYRAALEADALSTTLASLGAWGPAVFIAAFALGTVAFLPGAPFTLVGGALFGPVVGAFYSLIGATIGAILAFLAARHVASDWARGKAGPRLDRLVRGVEAEGWRFVAFTRLVPLFPFNLLNYALGLTRISLSHYTAATAVCMIPGALAYAYLGYAGREAAAGSETAVRSGVIALALLAAALFLPRLFKKRRGGGGLERLSAADLAARLDDGEAIAILDVRPAADFAGGHIPGATGIPLEDLAQRIGEVAAWRDAPLAVICRTNKRSAKAADLLAGEGFSHLLLVDDGMVGWSARGRSGDDVEGR